jgi:hypothetical protein
LKSAAFVVLLHRAMQWCPGPESNRHGREAEGFSCRFGFRRRLAPFVAWSTPSP